MLLSKVQTVLTSHIEMTDLAALPVMVVSIERQKLFCEFVEQTDKSKFVVQIAIYRDVWGSGRKPNGMVNAISVDIGNVQEWHEFS